MAEIQSFQDLKCWKQAVELRKMIRPLIESFPIEEKYRLSDQLTRAVRSVTTNIAEGFGRYHFQENIQFCRHSRGSLTEIQDHLIIALEEGYISEQQKEMAHNQTEICLALINGYINYLRKSKANSNE